MPLKIRKEEKVGYTIILVVFEPKGVFRKISRSDVKREKRNRNEVKKRA